MATAHAGVYISSRSLGDTPIDSINCRSRGLARRKRTSDCLWMAAPSSLSDGVGGANRSSSRSGGGVHGTQGERVHPRRYPSDGSGVDGKPAWEYASGLNEPLHDDGAHLFTLVGQEGSGVESHFSTDMFSSAVNKKEAREGSSGEIILTSDISARRGITMDSVHGSVRSKTLPKVSPATDPVVANESAGGTNSSQMPSMIELSAAVEEAAKQTPSVSSAGRNEVEAAMDTEPTERNYRATSSTVLLQPLLDDGLDVPKSKRAKSGVSLIESGVIASPPTSAGGSVGWFGDTRPHQTSSISSGISVTALSGAKRSPEGADSAGGGGSGGDDGGGKGGGGSGGNTGGGSAEAVSASGDPPLTNERWLEMLSPLLSMFKPGTHPEDYLHELLRERGYSTEMVAVKETAYHRPPHPDQVASYDKVILRAVLDNDEGALERMRASGKRMDCCNRFGDSILHMSCRRGRVGALRYLLRVCPSGVLLSDDFGRTIMHDACWTATPRFDVASAVLDADLRLLRCLDSRGSSPLQYVPQDQWPYWCAFFEHRKEIYWPPLAPGERDVAGDIPLAEGFFAGE